MHSDAKAFTSAVFRRIYLPKETFEDLKSKSPNHQNTAVLIHEEIHLRRVRNTNLIIYIFKFLVSRKFRLEAELEAYKEQFKYLKRHGLKYDLEKVAKDLSGKKYFWLTSYENAKALINEAWRDA